MLSTNQVRCMMCCAGAALIMAQPAAAQFSFSSQQILADGEWNSPSSTAIDSNGVTHMAYMTQHHTDSTTKELWYATDGGIGQWSFLQITDNNVREEFPHLELDSQGNVHVAFHTGTATSNMIRYVNNVDAAPGAFNPIIDITASGFKIVKHAIDSTGTVHFVFTSQTSNFTDEVFYTTWTPGVGVGPLMNLSQSPGNESNPHVAIDMNGKVHIVWSDGSISGPLMYMNNVNGPLAFAPTGVVGNTESAMLLMSQTNVVNIVYRIGDFLYAVDDGGTGTFGLPTPVYSGSYRPSFYNKFAIDQDGHRYIAFASNVGDNRGIFFVPETEKGFLTPIQISNTLSGNQGASVALNCHGKLVLSYQISGFDSKTSTVYADISVARSQIPQACPADVAPGCGDDAVNVSDLLAIIASWGECPSCAADINSDGHVNVSDLLAVIGEWGACP